MHKSRRLGFLSFAGRFGSPSDTEPRPPVNFYICRALHTPTSETTPARETERCAKLKPWTPDVLRHTAISHYFRQTGSYGQAAEQFGNSENIIRKLYQARVSTADTKPFYALRPAKSGASKSLERLLAD